jgi:hypothetical protein
MSFQADNQNTGSVNPGGAPSYPETVDLDAWLALDCNLFRFPVLWNYIQPSFDVELDNTVLTHLDQVVNYVTFRGAYAIVDIASS